MSVGDSNYSVGSGNMGYGKIEGEEKSKKASAPPSYSSDSIKKISGQSLPSTGKERESVRDALKGHVFKKGAFFAAKAEDIQDLTEKHIRIQLLLNKAKELNRDVDLFGVDLLLGELIQQFAAIEKDPLLHKDLGKKINMVKELLEEDDVKKAIDQLEKLDKPEEI